MFLHIGGGKNLRKTEIIGIFDMDTATVAAHTKNFLSSAQRSGKIVNVSDELPKSFILTGKPLSAFAGKKDEERVYLSQLAPQTLAQRK